MVLRETHLEGSRWIRALLSFILCLLLTSYLSAQNPPQTNHVPSGWSLAGNSPASYRTGLDRAAMPGGAPSAYLASTQAKVAGFGTLMQTINAQNYLGKRVRLRGWVKSQDAADWAGLWMRVDKSKTMVAFDNMQDRSIKGTQAWNSYDIVLDVPSDATAISFGILLAGTGEVWLNDVTLEVVDNDTKTTGQGMTPSNLPKTPVNLTFNE
jgi:hypothetical protein